VIDPQECGKKKKRKALPEEVRQADSVDRWIAALERIGPAIGRRIIGVLALVALRHEAWWGVLPAVR
jgi:hypothetical protein